MRPFALIRFPSCYKPLWANRARHPQGGCFGGWGRGSGYRTRVRGPGNAGPALRPCGSSSGAGSGGAASKIIRIPSGCGMNPTAPKPSLIRTAQCASRCESRKAGKRALRYVFSWCGSICAPAPRRDRGPFPQGRTGTRESLITRDTGFGVRARIRGSGGGAGHALLLIN